MSKYCRQYPFFCNFWKNMNKKSHTNFVPVKNNPVLDKIDVQILSILQENNLLTNIDLAEKVNLSPPPCLRRVKRLNELGVITHNVAIINPEKVGHNLVVFISITLEKQREDLLQNFERKMMEHTEITQCYFVSGETDYLLVAQLKDMPAYNEFARKVFANEPNIKVFRSSFCLNRIKYSTRISVQNEN